MAAINGTLATPSLVSYTSYTSFLNELREHDGGVPNRIDKSLMPRASGSQASAMMAALKFLEHIDDVGKPTDAFKKLVLASDDERKPMLAALLKDRYGFLFTDPEFDLEKATSAQMAEKFRDLGISGSTVTKTIAFFLALAKDAGIKFSSHIKPPSAPKGATSAKRSTKRKSEDAADSTFGEEVEDEDDGVEAERFEIPIPGKTSVKVIVPRDLDADDWEMLQHMITAYIKRWKGFQTQPKEGK